MKQDRPPARRFGTMSREDLQCPKCGAEVPLIGELLMANCPECGATIDQPDADKIAEACSNDNRP